MAAMLGSAVMTRCQTTRDLDRIFDRFVRRESIAHALAKGLSLKKLSDDEGRAIVHAEVVDRHDVWMAEARGRARFLFQSALASGIA